MNFKIYRISKVIRQINFGKNYQINTRVNLKTRYIWEKKKHTILREMYWSYVLGRAGSNFCVNDNFPGTFIDFRVQIFSEERIGT